MELICAKTKIKSSESVEIHQGKSLKIAKRSYLPPLVAASMIVFRDILGLSG